MSSRHTTPDDDEHVPQPVWFAQQLGWCSGPQGPWTWKRLMAEASRRYATAKATRLTEAA